MIRPQIRTVPGVTEVNTIGGYEKQFHVTPDPAKLLAYGLEIPRRARGTRPKQCQRGRGLHRAKWRAVSDPGSGAGHDLNDIRHIVVGNHHGVPIHIEDVAEVGLGKELRTGAATRTGKRPSWAPCSC